MFAGFIIVVRVLFLNAKQAEGCNGVANRCAVHDPDAAVWPDLIAFAESLFLAYWVRAVTDRLPI